MMNSLRTIADESAYVFVRARHAKMKRMHRNAPNDDGPVGAKAGTVFKEFKVSVAFR